MASTQVLLGNRLLLVSPFFTPTLDGDGLDYLTTPADARKLVFIAGKRYMIGDIEVRSGINK